MPGIQRFLLWTRALLARRTADAELTREMRFHLEMEVEKNIRAGMSADEARRRALVDFGGVQRFREEVSVERGGRWVNGLSLDLKLAWRMLRKSPGLTVVGVLGIALGVAIHVGAFVVLTTLFFPEVPLDEGDRIVALENWDVEANRPAPHSLHDFVTWREELRSVQPVAAASMDIVSIFTGSALPQTARAAEMTASAFQIARVQPFLGRYLLPEDEREGAPRVVVIGHDLWQWGFASDPNVVGRTMVVHGFEHVLVEHTVIGVMPPGFLLPVNQHFWIPLRASPVRHTRGQGPELFVFGRLSPGATWEQAQAELTVIGRRAAAAFPETNARLRPQILPYTYPLSNTRVLDLAEVATMELMVTLLLVAIAVNVGMLVYARTAMRQGEIAVRTALGASRRRIVGQLFVEALLLAIIGAAIGLGAAHVGVRELDAAFNRHTNGFWVDHSLQPRSVALALALAILCAVIVGVVPGLTSTGRGLNASLQLFRSGASPRMGRTWTALIVAQVAVVVAALPTAVYIGYDQIRERAERAKFPAHEFLKTFIAVDVPVQPGTGEAEYVNEMRARLGVAFPALEQRLEADPAVAGVTLEGGLPGRTSLVEIDGVPGSEAFGAHRVDSRGVATDYFPVLGARVLTGRDFRAGDAGGSAGGLIVSEAFVRTVLNGGPALGRQVRFVGGEPAQRFEGPWLEIVGVVEDLYANPFDREDAPEVVYYAVAPEQLSAASLLVRVRGVEADAFIPRLQDITRIQNPDVRLGSVRNLAVTPNSRYFAALVTGVTLALVTVVLLSAAGINALMSMTVTRRRKEIGIRIALGARAGRLLGSIFSRAAWQLGLGGLIGSLLGARLLRVSGNASADAPAVLGVVVVLMLVAGLAAAVGPARRGARIHPMEALRDE